MTYKQILAPGGKQQRPTITSLGFKEGTELIILSLEDYERLNLKDNRELMETIDKQKEIILNLENDKQQLKEANDNKEETINNLIERNNKLSQDLEANKINKTKLDETIKELDLLKETVSDKVNTLVLSNENTAIKILTNLDNEYKNVNFIDRVFNRMSNKIDLTKYTDQIKQTYNNELETTKANLLLTSEKIENYNNTGVIDPDETETKK